MAFGGGTFTVQNKVLPGAYINFISVSNVSPTLSERGAVALGLELDWGEENTIFEVTSEDFLKQTKKIFGYEYINDKLKGLRDVFQYATTLYAYRLNSGGIKASNEFATANYAGIRGNDFKVVIQSNVDEAAKFDVMLYLETSLLDTQTVSNAAELKPNDYVEWKTDVELKITAGTNLQGGTNGTVTGEQHQKFLDLLESYSFHALGCLSTEESVKSLYVAYTKRMREEVGAKFQTVLYQKPADYEGIVNVRNATVGEKESNLIYWVTGVIGGCAVNQSNQNKQYQGEFDIVADDTQKQLEQAIKEGEFVLHKVGSQIRVLADINSLVTLTDRKGDMFQENQTIRVIDQIAIDIANLFVQNYLGIVPNDEAGRSALWLDIVKQHEQLRDIRAIENFSDTDITVAKGNTKKSVVVSDSITPVNAMGQLYMTVQVQ